MEIRGNGRREKRIESVVKPEIQMIPIVQPGPSEVILGQSETEGTDQMKGPVQTDTETADCTGIVRDFWVQQDDVHGEIITENHRVFNHEELLDLD